MFGWTCVELSSDSHLDNKDRNVNLFPGNRPKNIKFATLNVEAKNVDSRISDGLKDRIKRETLKTDPTTSEWIDWFIIDFTQLVNVALIP
jgi:hypothetical protein